MKDDLHFLRLWDLYSPLLTATQREITDLYFNYDLSLGEIAEQKGVSRQSVSDCLHKSRSQLEKYEQRLKFAKALDELLQEYSAYAAETERWLAATRQTVPEMSGRLNALQEKLRAVQKGFGSDGAPTPTNTPTPTAKTDGGIFQED